MGAFFAVCSGIGWLFVVYAVFLYILIAYNDVIWAATNLTTIEEWQSLLDVTDEKRNRVVDACFLLNSFGYIINILFYGFLLEYKRISLKWFKQIGIFALSWVLYICVKNFINYFLKWEYVYFLLLPNLIFVTVILVMLFLSRNK